MLNKKRKKKKVPVPKDSNIIKINKLENSIETILKRENERSKFISIIIMSVDQKILFRVICELTDKVNFIEKNLYKEYPELKGTKFYFLFKGEVLDKFKSLKKNDIKNGDKIILNEIEESEEIS